MAEVWEGYDRALDRQVAVKVIRRSGLPSGADYEKVKERFARECRVTAKVEHPGVPVVHDVGTHEGEAYLVMQLVRGHNVGDVIAERGPLPVAWAAAIGAQICSALAAAHNAALVHRDLKPTNIMLCPDGTVKVLDFGIAAVLDDVDLMKLTTTGHPLGSASYMAPEQILGNQVSPATDLYGLGCVLHELLAGAPPFHAETSFALLQRHLSASPPELQPVRPDVPGSLAELVQRLLAKGPGERPADAFEVYKRLMPYIVEAAADGAAPAAEMGPTRPYYFPFGPLPMLRTTTMDTSRLVRSPSPLARPGSEAAVRALREQQERAGRLVEEGRVTRASQVLADATWAAAAALRSDHPEVVDARLSLANMYLLGADHRRALVEFERLMPDLRRHFDRDHDIVRGARRGVAECHAALGDLVRARSELRALFDELRQLRDPGDPELAELREELRRLGEAI
jgi:tRNA A-37 threonylcarbamoyl transferase component Bud32